MNTKAFVAASVLALAFGGAARADQCTITVGLVMELTGPAGEYGQAGAKSVEMAFRDLNDAGGAHGCKLVADTRDSQSQGAVAVDAANQLVQLKKVPVIIGGIISSVSIPILTSVTGPAKIVQVSPASSSPTLTTLGREGKTNGMFFRTITSDALQGTAAAKYALDQGFKRIAVIHVNNDFGTNMFGEFAKVYKALGGEIVSVTPYNEKQSSYDAEATAAIASKPDGLYLIATPVDGATIARAWISQGGPAKFLLNDGMNSPDFIASVGAKYLNEAYGTSSGTNPTRFDRIFQRQLQGVLRHRPEQSGRRPRLRRRRHRGPGDRRGAEPGSRSPSATRSSRSPTRTAPSFMPAKPTSPRRSTSSRRGSRSAMRASSGRSRSTSTATSPGRSACGRSPTAR